MTAETLISRFDKVKQTGQGRWVARCPAHEDKSPSLSIRELDDGRTLLNCFSGCSVHEVLSAVGLTFSDLYPPREIQHGKPERRPFPAADVLRCIAFEALVVAVAGNSMSSGVPFTLADRERLTLAVGRIQDALTVAGVRHG